MRGETCGKHGQGKTPLGYRLWPRCVGCSCRCVPGVTAKWRQGQCAGGRHRVAAETSVVLRVGCLKPHSRLFPQVAGLVVPVGELPELAQSAPPARYEGPGRKVIVGATG